MIISRKKFEEEINKAVAAKEEEIWQQNRKEAEFRHIWERMHELERRLYKIEPHGKNDVDMNAIINRPQRGE